MANMMLVYMHVASKMISWALVHACVILNVLSSPDSSRAALADGSSPGSAFLGVMHDVTRFLAPLFSYAIDQTKSLPKNVRPTGELVLYLGLAPDVNACVVAPLTNIHKTRLSSSMLINPDPSMRPVDMEIHDLLSVEMSLVPQSEDSFQRSCRSLLDCSRDIGVPRVYVYSPVTQQPVTLR